MNGTRLETAAPVRGREDWISLVKVLGIAGVVLVHVTALSVVRGGPEGSTTRLVVSIMDYSQTWAVPAFVAASGATLLGANAWSVASVRRRIPRIITSLVVWHLVYIVFAQLVLDRDDSLREMAVRVVTGRTYTALYFFWLILGLYVVAPLIARAIAGLSARHLWALVVLALLVPTMLHLVDVVRAADSVTLRALCNNALTIWLPYVGFFIAGHAIRHHPPDRVPTWLVAALGLLSGVTVVTAMMSTTVSEALSILNPAVYYGLPNTVYAVCVVELARRVATRTGLLNVGRLRPAVQRWGGRTLGIFATHLLFLYAAVATVGAWPAGGRTLPQVAVLYAVVLGSSMAFVVIGERVPGLRRIV